ncbi:unnamed protein product [Owenia fusiformis]|uniref:sn-1-specific diacylglycerol lipase ABHD11 n=1 Tax=Owenia fusiformis TaxID=6347 RepID=A0A8J1YAN2_OWEFU|nr:unnamed protein product [Owenia fusiformis]
MYKRCFGKNINNKVIFITSEFCRNFCQKAENRGVKLAYASYQSTKQILPKKESPLVIIHGLFGSKRNWQSLGKAFAKTGRKVVAVDCRNHGESPHTDKMDYYMMCEDIQLLLEELQISKANIIGHSMGGKVAMTLALTKPGLVDKLIIEDISPRVSPVLEVYPAYMSAMQEITFDNTVPLSQIRKFVVEHLESVVPDAMTREFIATNIKETQDEIHWGINLDTIDRCFEKIADFPKFTNCFQGDTLFIAGRNSQHIRKIDFPLIKQLFPESRVEYIEDAGHWVHVEKPREFMKAVIQFLNPEEQTPE